MNSGASNVNRLSDETRTVAQAWFIIFLAVQILLLSYICYSMVDNIGGMSKADAICATLDVFCIIITILFFSGSMRINVDRFRNDAYYTLLLFNSIYLFSDGMFYILKGDPSQVQSNLIVNEVYSICPMVMLMLFMRFLEGWKNIQATGHTGQDRMTVWVKRLVDAIAVIQIAAVLGNAAGGYMFYIDTQGNYVRGQWYTLLQVIPTVLTLLLTVYIVTNIKPLFEKLLLIAYPLLPWLCYLISGSYFTPALVSTVTSLSLISIYVHLAIRRERVIKEQQQQIERSRLRIVQMQLNPHFIYNTLASIAGLCETDPAAARDMTYRVSDYMRANFRDGTDQAMITFRDELARLKSYVEIEQIRFPGVSVEYDVEEDRFMIPAMTLQPLVENAIKYGIRPKDDEKGTIRISTGQTENGWNVVVSDDGMGFDTDELKRDEKGTGIKNVTTRLKLLCNGELTVSSRKGEGTRCVIFIPGSPSSPYLSGKDME